MTKPKFDQDYWEQLWSKTLREHSDQVARRPPNAQLALVSMQWSVHAAEPELARRQPFFSLIRFRRTGSECH